MNKQKVYVIDLTILSEYDLSVNETLALIAIHDVDFEFDDTGVDYNSLEKKKFIKIIKDAKTENYLIRQRAVDLINRLVGEGIATKKRKKKKEAVNVDIVTRLPEFRAKWKGLKAGSMGSLSSCKDKLTRWMSENPEYTFDDVLKAADAYIESLGGDYRFLQRADYFIYKQENNREESSRLSAFIDELSINGEQGDWTTKLN